MSGAEAEMERGWRKWCVRCPIGKDGKLKCNCLIASYLSRGEFLFRMVRGGGMCGECM